MIKRISPLFVIILLSVLLLGIILGIVLYETTAGEPLETWQRPFSGERININTATASELMALDGMRAKIANRVVAYRERHLRFATIYELGYVDGIDRDDIARWEPYITV